MNTEQRKAVEECIPIAHNMAEGDEDLEQELLLTACLRAQDGNTDVPRLIYFMLLRRLEYRAGRGNGKSVDNGEKRNRQDVQVTHDPAVLDLAVESHYERAHPDDTAIFRAGISRFLESLTSKELTYWDARVDSCSVPCSPSRTFTQWYCRTVRPSLRRKFRDQFDM